MRILFVTPSYWPAFQFGGPIYAAHGMNRALVKRGVDLTVYTTNVGLEETVPVNREVDLDGVRVFYFSFSRIFEVVASTGWQLSFAMTRALYNNVKAFDVIHIAGIWNYPIAAAAHQARKSGVPYIIKPMGALYPYSERGKRWKKRPYYLLISRRDISQAAAIHYVSRHEQETCHSLHGLKNRAVVLPSGIDTPELPERDALKRRYPILRGKKTILFLGRIHRIKGLDILANAFGQMARERQDVHLLIAGPDQQGYGKLVKELLVREGVERCVTFTGMLTGTGKSEALAGSDVLVLPSYSESLGLAVLEAMSCGIPVVMSTGCHVEGVDEAGAGYVVPPRADAILGALRSLLDDEDLCRRMGENGRRFVQERYTWGSVAERMIDEYARIILDHKVRQSSSESDFA